MTQYTTGGTTVITVGTTTISGGSDGDILYNNGGVVGGFQLYDDTGAGNGAFALRKTMSGSALTSNFFSVTGTLPTVLTAMARGASLQLTGAGSSGQPIVGLKVDILAGYTGISGGGAVLGSNATIGAAGGTDGPFQNSAFVSGVDLPIIGVGGEVTANANTSQTKVGVYGRAISGGRNYGVAGESDASGNFSVGGGFRAQLIAAGSMGVYGAITGAGTHIPTFPATATVAVFDNTTQVADILLLRDNGTPVLTVPDGGNLYMGAVTDATPAAATINGEGGTGTNIAGAKLTVAAGIGTGNAVPAVVAVAATAMGGASGAAAQTNVDRQIIGATEVLTNNTVTTVVSCTLANDTVGAFKVAYAVEVFDATDVQVEVGEVTFKITNKGGVIANNTAVKYGNQQSMTAGTLTVTWTITAANPALIQINANSSLTPSAGYPRVTFRLDDLTQQAVVLA